MNTGVGTHVRQLGRIDSILYDNFLVLFGAQLLYTGDAPGAYSVII
jgi:hypothetical protein